MSDATQAVPEVDTAAEAFFAQHTMATGRKITLGTEPKGRDLESAFVVLGNKVGNGLSLSLALLARCALIDGKKRPYEMLVDELTAEEAYELHLWVSLGYGKKIPSNPL